MKGKNFVSCIMCFALTASLFSVSSGWASENEMNLAEESRVQFSLEEECSRAASALSRSMGDSGKALTVQNGETREDTVLVKTAEADMASAQTASANRYYGADGRLYGTDMNEYFIGDPFTEGGIMPSDALGGKEPHVLIYRASRQK